MLKQRNEQVQAAARGIDVIVAVAAFFAAYKIRSLNLPIFHRYSSIEPIENLTWLLGVSIALHLIIYPICGFYESLRMKSVLSIIAMVIRAGVIEFFVMGAIIFLVQAKTTSRYFFIFFISINYSLILAEKLGVRFLLSSVRRRGYNFRKVVIVGTGNNARRIIQSLSRNKHWGYIPAGILIADESGHESDLGVPVLGRLADLEGLAKTQTIDEVIFAMERLDASELSSSMELCASLGIPNRVSLGLFEHSNRKVVFSQIEEIPLVTFYTTLRTPLEELLKRVIDIGVSLIGIVITLLVAPWISWRIRRESPGPVLFKQIRVGENGRLFRCYKFRTMGLDAEAKKVELTAQNKMKGPIFKIDDDPRVFPFGKFLRKSSIDELPQFFNVLRGDMSVVGTRPPTPDEVKSYPTHFRKRLSIRPGVTGLWQVSGRNSITDFEEVLTLDLEYIERWSLALDIKIIFKTIWIAIRGKGAA